MSVICLLCKNQLGEYEYYSVMAFVGKIKSNYLTLYCTLVSISIVNVATNWPIVRLIRAKQELDFGDAGIILNATDCFSRIGMNVYAVKSGSCSYNYGEGLIRVLNLLGLGIGSITAIGILFVLLFIVAFIESLRVLQPVATFKLQIIAATFFVSPPVMLLLERGNFDSLIFFLIIFSLILEIKGKILSSTGLLVVSSLFKFYTFPLLVLKLVTIKKQFNFFKLRIIFVFLTFGVILRDLARISEGFSIPNPMWLAFGSSKFPWAIARVLGIDLSRPLQLIAGALLSLILLLGLIRFQSRFPQIKELKLRLLEMNSGSKLMTESLAFIFLISYFSGMSYIYRLVFVIPVFICLIMCQSQSYTLINALITLAIFLSPWFGGLEIIGDFAILLLVTIFIWMYLPKSLTLKI